MELPATLSFHPVFHTCLLKPWNVNSLAQPPPTPIIIDGQEEYPVEAIIGHRFSKKGKARTLYFLVKWAVHGSEHNNWDPAAALEGCAALDHYKGGKILVDDRLSHTAV